MDFYRIGLITKPHGVQGGVKLLPLTDDTARFRGLQQAYLERTDGQRESIAISDIRVRPDAVTLKISGVDTMEQAQARRGAYISVDRAHARTLPPDTWFVADLIGCKVEDDAGKMYGEIADVLQTGANDVYLLQSGMMIPALKRVLRLVDVEQKRIVVIRDVLEEVAVFAD